MLNPNLFKPIGRSAWIFLVLLMLPGTAAWGYQPSLEEAMTRILYTSSGVTRGIFEFKSRVYDPVKNRSSREDASSERIPPELSERNFNQKIYWIKGAFLAIETFSEDGKPLHFYIEENFTPVSAILDEARPFSARDVFHPYIPFIDGAIGNLKSGIGLWGVQPTRVRIIRGGKGEVFLRLEESTRKALLINRSDWRADKIETRIEGGTRPLNLTIEFKDFVYAGNQQDETHDLRIPRTVNYLLDGNLFKQTVLIKFSVNNNWRFFPLSRLRKEAEKHIEAGKLKEKGDNL